ncbi:MAG TPA: GNAT family N-acetyltransferase [Kribbella sp.]
MTEFVVRSVVETDAPAVARPIAASFDEPIRPDFIYCQPGASAHLGVLASWPLAFPDHNLYSATSLEGTLLGFAEFRSTAPNSCLLSYVCVAPAARDLGRAERLILEHLDTHSNIAYIELNVFSNNAVARCLYDRLGFVTSSLTHWWRRELPVAASNDHTRLRVADWRVSLATLERHGFCTLSANHHGHKVQVGVTSQTIVRVADHEQFGEDELLAGVRFLLPGTQSALLIDNALPGGRFRVERVIESRRLYADFSTVKEAQR